MARKRMIDPNFWRDEKIAKCSYMERLLFEGLWTFAEDNGVGRASPLLIKADIFPYDSLREADIQKSLAKLASLGLILLYEIEGQSYYYVLNFLKHQTINKPSKCYLPEPLPEHYGSTTVVVTPEDNIKEDNIIKQNRGVDFERFWKAYPRKVAKADALKAFEKNVPGPLLETVLNALEKQKRSEDWTRDSGRYIPYPATWLNGKRWEDEQEPKGRWEYL